MRRGIIYCLSNVSMPGLYKIGRTSRKIETRIQELNGATGVPTPFRCELTRELPDAVLAENIAHKVLAPYRENPQREFFRLADVETARICFEAIGLQMEQGDARDVPLL